MRSNDANPSSPHETASPSIMQDCERSLLAALRLRPWPLCASVNWKSGTSCQSPILKLSPPPKLPAANSRCYAIGGLVQHQVARVERQGLAADIRAAEHGRLALPHRTDLPGRPPALSRGEAPRPGV